MADLFICVLILVVITAAPPACAIKAAVIVPAEAATPTKEIIVEYEILVLGNDAKDPGSQYLYGLFLVPLPPDLKSISYSDPVYY